MKCPKCDYLGFETGNRCRNCGYDFSLVAMAAPSSDLDLPLHSPLASMHAAALPLFTDSPTDDIPLVHVPAVPRAPLAVRRTPDTPRAKAPAFVRRRADETLSLEFPPAARVPVERPAGRPFADHTLQSRDSGRLRQLGRPRHGGKDRQAPWRTGLGRE